MDDEVEIISDNRNPGLNNQPLLFDNSKNKPPILADDSGSGNQTAPPEDRDVDQTQYDAARTTSPTEARANSPTNRLRGTQRDRGRERQRVRERERQHNRDRDRDTFRERQREREQRQRQRLRTEREVEIFDYNASTPTAMHHQQHNMSATKPRIQFPLNQYSNVMNSGYSDGGLTAMVNMQQNGNLMPMNSMQQQQSGGVMSMCNIQQQMGGMMPMASVQQQQQSSVDGLLPMPIGSSGSDGLLPMSIGNMQNSAVGGSLLGMGSNMQQQPRSLGPGLLGDQPPPQTGLMYVGDGMQFPQTRQPQCRRWRRCRRCRRLPLTTWKWGWSWRQMVAWTVAMTRLPQRHRRTRRRILPPVTHHRLHPPPLTPQPWTATRSLHRLSLFRPRTTTLPNAPAAPHCI